MWQICLILQICGGEVVMFLLVKGKPNKQTKNYSSILHILEVQTEIILEKSELDTWLYTDLEA